MPRPSRTAGAVVVTTPEVRVGEELRWEITGAPPKGTPKTGDPSWWVDIVAVDAAGDRVFTARREWPKDPSVRIEEDPRFPITAACVGNVNLITSHDDEHIYSTASFTVNP